MELSCLHLEFENPSRNPTQRKNIPKSFENHFKGKRKTKEKTKEHSCIFCKLKFKVKLLLFLLFTASTYSSKYLSKKQFELVTLIFLRPIHGCTLCFQCKEQASYALNYPNITQIKNIKCVKVQHAMLLN